MGTNYYYLKERIGNIEDVESGLHIGKNSLGWVFHFEAHNEPKLKTVQDYKNYLKEGFIYDEYAREIPYYEFWEIVEDSKQLFNGRKPWVLTDEPNKLRVVWFNDWVDEGLAFTECEFV